MSGKQRTIQEEALDAREIRIKRDIVVARRVAQVNIDNLAYAFNISKLKMHIKEVLDDSTILGAKYIVEVEGLTFEIIGQTVRFICTCEECEFVLRTKCKNFDKHTSRQSILEDVGEGLWQMNDHKALSHPTKRPDEQEKTLPVEQPSTTRIEADW